MMKQEIELKFIVDPKRFMDVVSTSRDRIDIVQGYLFGNSHMRVRNIISDDSKNSVITIKGDREGISRTEFEYSIPYKEGVALLENFATAVIYKTRYLITNDNNSWEVDDFHGKNHGLILAEIEIPEEDYTVSLPHWLINTKNVAEDDRYYNYHLATHPYSEWGPKED